VFTKTLSADDRRDDFSVCREFKLSRFDEFYRNKKHSCQDLIRLFKSATVVSPCTPGSSTNSQSSVQSQALFLKKVHNVALSTCFSREGMT
jgi:hypothetical protein